MCPIGFLMLGSTLQTCRAISLPQEASLAVHRLHQRMILTCTRPILVGHAVELATAQPPPDDDGQVHTDASAGPAPPAPASRTRRRRRQTTSRAWTQRATTPTPAIPAIRLPAPPPRSRTSLRPDTADAATHRHRTPTPDAGQWTPGRSDARTGHWTAVRWTGKRDTGRSHRTPHWTPDAGRGLGQGDEGAAGIRTSWATTPSDRALERPTVFLWTAPAALGSPCRLGGEAAFQREIASRRQLLGRSPGSSGASAHCCPRMISGR